MGRSEDFGDGYVGARGERPPLRFGRVDMTGWMPAPKGYTSYSMQALPPKQKGKRDSGPMYGQVLYDEDPEAKKIRIGKIYVHEEHRRKGIASALTDTLVRSHPEHHIDWGGFEPMGEKWRKGYNKKTGSKIRGYRI